MDNDIAVIGHFDNLWPEFPKNQLWEKRALSGEIKVMFACQVQDIGVLLAVIIGRQGGLREEIFVIDMLPRPVLVDRLLLAKATRIGDGYLLPLREMRDKIRRGDCDPLTVCREHMELGLQDMLARPGWYYSKLCYPRILSESPVVFATKSV